MVRTSWVSVTLAAALGVTMPLVATMAGTALATPIAVLSAAVSVVVETHPGAVHDAAPPYDTQANPSPGCPRGQKGRWNRPAEERSTHGVGPRERPGPRAGRGLDRAPEPVVVVSRRSVRSRRPRSTTACPIVIRLDAVNAAGTWGQVELPYVWPRRDGWIALDAPRARADLHPRRRRPVASTASASTNTTSSCTGAERDRHAVLPHASRGTTSSRTASRSLPGARSDRSRSGSAGSNPTYRPGGAAGTSSRSTARTTPRRSVRAPRPVASG